MREIDNYCEFVCRLLRSRGGMSPRIKILGAQAPRDPQSWRLRERLSREICTLHAAGAIVRNKHVTCRSVNLLIEDGLQKLLLYLCAELYFI